MKKQELLLRLKALQGHQGTTSLPENSSLLMPPGEAEYLEGERLMETVQQSHKRHRKIHSSPVTQQSVPDTPASWIIPIFVGIIPAARVVAEDLIKTNLREGSPNILWMASSGVGQQVTSESIDSHSWVVPVEPSTTSHHLLSQEHLPCTQVDLAPVVVQQVAVVEIPMSQDRMFPI